LSDKHGAKESRVIFTQFAGGKVGNENLFLIHDTLDVNFRSRMSDGITDISGRNKLTDFIKNWGDGFVLKFLIHTTKFVDPKIFKSRIGELADDFVTVIFVGKDFNNMG